MGFAYIVTQGDGFPLSGQRLRPQKNESDNVRNSSPWNAQGDVFFLDIPFYRTRTAHIHILRKLTSLAVNFAGFFVQHSQTVSSFQPSFLRAALFLISLNLVFPRLSLQNFELDAGLTLP